MPGVLVIADVADGALSPITAEMLGAATRVAGLWSMLHSNRTPQPAGPHHKEPPARWQFKGRRERVILGA